MTWKYYTFAELGVDLLYEIIQLRLEVFVVEQTCYYQDADGKDQAAIHFCCFNEARELVAYTRILDRGVSYADYASIGRVLTGAGARGQGLGRPLMRRSVEVLYEVFGQQPIKISAQAHLQKFYNSVGFEGVGEIYDEDGIPHRGMVYSPPCNP